MFGKMVSGIIGGLIIAILGALVVTVAIASEPESGGQAGAVAFLVFWIFGLVLALTASRAGKAWRRILVTSAILSFAMPLSSFIFTGSQVTKAATQGGEYAAAAAAGAALGGGLITAITGFLGFFLGIIFLVVGLLTGRDKEVVVIKEGGGEK